MIENVKPLDYIDVTRIINDHIRVEERNYRIYVLLRIFFKHNDFTFSATSEKVINDYLAGSTYSVDLVNQYRIYVLKVHGPDIAIHEELVFYLGYEGEYSSSLKDFDRLNTNHAVAQDRARFLKSIDAMSLMNAIQVWNEALEELKEMHNWAKATTHYSEYPYAQTLLADIFDIKGE